MTLVADGFPVSRQPVPAARAARRMVAGPVAAGRPMCRHAASRVSGR